MIIEVVIYHLFQQIYYRSNQEFESYTEGLLNCKKQNASNYLLLHYLRSFSNF